MKRFKLFAGAAAFLAMGALSACQSDDLQQPGEQVAETNETRYITVSLSAPYSQARSFEDGTKDESEVVRLDFIFYDSNGKSFGKKQTFSKDDKTLDQTQFEDDANGDNVTRFWTSVVPVELVQGQNLPAYVICIVNGQDTKVAEYAVNSMQSLREAERSSFVTGQNFTMSNSVYFGTDANGAPNQRLCATTINAATQLFKSREDAENAVKENAEAAMVNIYVERLAAKVGLSYNGTQDPVVLFNGETGTGTVNLRFKPEYWFVNATSKSIYTTKRYGVQKTDGSIEYRPEYSDIVTALGDWTTWNDPENSRSYWGCSPSYYKNLYPSVSDQINDLEGRTTVPEGSNVPLSDQSDKYAMTYYTYNQIKAEAAKTNDVTKQAIAADKDNATFKAEPSLYSSEKSSGYIYTKETTTAIKQITAGSNPAAAVASAVIVGHYSVDDVPVADNASIWIDTNDRPSIGENDNKTQTAGKYYSSEAKVMQVLAMRQSVVYTDANGSSKPDLTKADTYNPFVLEHPKYAVRKLLKNSDLAGRLVTIQLPEIPEGDTHDYYFFDTTVKNDEGTYGKFVKITNDNLNRVNAALVTAGYMNQYYSGHGFFSIPIRHLNFKPSMVDAKGVYDWKNMKVGALGIVRNHVYNITIDKISGLATGIRSNEQPIVPPVTSTDQYVAVRLNILAWNVVDGWHVNL